ncbi:MAG: hypothetical protein O4803_11745 [Trichodesmium sp. St15_bin1_1]|nr:hypothetical protein [Trichodesmium sp. St5_bin2_1]MDE5082047.1 hypothetical protein [Trichodesmium sp. St18_bin1]MDE5086121.1 hypothetical protein [Trichodesmium sp. St16_bin2-tuft]MDE5108432.1 hypothetical protein [Trichodesmium sp. St17_bin3_1_1]MDE5114878.1 hypothetical protein [Trichodesmium sp. St15_bin1_1]MDE5118060.1 hypothetical protein [Trichodesmium sp. St2_bin2_1]MDE5121498.1 hypothetical protein [Trichodesmium sp. St19_bin1]
MLSNRSITESSRVTQLESQTIRGRKPKVTEKLTQVIEKLIDSLAEIVIKATEQEEMFLHFTQN